MTDELLLGVGVGTASTKGILATPAGEIVGRHETPHELSVPRPGWAEHDAEKTWWGRLSPGQPRVVNTTSNC